MLCSLESVLCSCSKGYHFRFVWLLVAPDCTSLANNLPALLGFRCIHIFYTRHCTYISTYIPGKSINAMLYLLLWLQERILYPVISVCLQENKLGVPNLGYQSLFKITQMHLLISTHHKTAYLFLFWLN